MEYREFFLRVWHKMNDSILKQLETRVEKKKYPKKALKQESFCVREELSNLILRGTQTQKV